MVFRIDPERFPNRAKVQFTTSAAMPHLIYRACIATGKPSNTVYVQHAICEALSRDLGIPLADLMANLPTPRGPSAHLYDPSEHTMARGKNIRDSQAGGRMFIGPANTCEEVR